MNSAQVINTSRSSGFKSADTKLLTHMKERIANKLPSFLAPMNLAFEETVHVAFMLNEMINAFKAGPRRRTFFCNSHLEAVQGAIKIARHFRKKKDSDSDGKVLFVDEDNYYEKYFDPTQVSSRDAIIPGVEMVRGEDWNSRLANGRFRILVISVTQLPGMEYEPLHQYCRENDIVTILDASRVRSISQDGLQEAALNHFDIVCWGEALSNFQMPFGAFSTTLKIYNVWSSIRTCSVHSSTFGSNGMVLSYVRKYLYDLLPIFFHRHKYRRFFSNTTQSSSRKLREYKARLNPGIPVFFRSMKIDVNIQKAEGSYIYARSLFGRPKKKLDCVGSGGCSVFGHNREDILSKVLDKHSPGFDYFSQLNEKLYGATGLEKMFQAVSGASAVEMGLIMALLAAGTKKKVLIFKGNFGGKTLAAMNVTAANHYYFNPAYKDVKIIDPHASNAAEETIKLLASGEIALVWMEVIQGRTLTAIPDKIIAIINEYKNQYEYFIGIDEVLNGINRTGEFTSFDPATIRPDIITFAKGFSGMVMPISVVMLSDEVYKRAILKNEETVTFLENLYRNQLSSHIAVHIMDKLTSERIRDNVSALSSYLVEGITKIASGSSLIRNIEAHGLHIHVNMDIKRFPFRYFGYDGTNFILTELFYKKAGFLSLFGRLLPPLNLQKDQAQQIINGMSAVFSLHPRTFFWIGIRQMAYRIYHMLLHKIFHR